MIRSRLGPTSLAIALALIALVRRAGRRPGPGGDRQARSDEQEGARRLRHARVGLGQEDAARRAGRGQEGRARQPPGHGPDLRPPGRGLHHRLQEPRQGDPELQPRARDRSRPSSCRRGSRRRRSTRRSRRPSAKRGGGGGRWRRRRRRRRARSAAARSWRAATKRRPRRRRGRRARRRRSTSDDDVRREGPAGQDPGARLPERGRGDHRQGGHVALRGRAEPSGRQGVPACTRSPARRSTPSSR